MSELEKVKSSDVTLKIGGRDRKIKFGFSAWAKIEEEYNGIGNIAQLEKDVEEKPFKYIPHLIYLGLQDKEGVTEETVLDDYSMGDIKDICEVLYKALYGSLPKVKAEKK